MLGGVERGSEDFRHPRIHFQETVALRTGRDDVGHPAENRPGIRDQKGPWFDLEMQAAELYREEVYTDRRIGSIRVLTPVDGSGERDSSRQVSYVGQTQIMTPMGSLPISFEIPANDLGEAAASQYAGAAKKAIDQAVEELKELRREAASSIVLPEAGGGGGGGMPGGGMPGGLGGGKFHMP